MLFSLSVAPLVAELCFGGLSLENTDGDPVKKDATAPDNKSSFSGRYIHVTKSINLPLRLVLFCDVCIILYCFILFILYDIYFSRSKGKI